VGTGGLGTEVPSRVHWQSPGVGLGAKPIQSALCSGQMHFHRRYMVYLQAHAESATLPSTPPKELFEFGQISRPTLAEVGWAHAHLWLRQCSRAVLNCVSAVSFPGMKNGNSL